MITRRFEAVTGSHLRDSFILPEAIRYQQSVGGCIHMLTHKEVRGNWAGLQYNLLRPLDIQRTTFLDSDLIIVEEMPDPYHKLYRPILQGVQCEVWMVNGPTIPWSQMYFHEFYNPYGQLNRCTETQFYEA